MRRLGALFLKLTLARSDLILCSSVSHIGRTVPTFLAAELDATESYRLLSALVVPRPIAWISSISADGVRNLAPHSFFNMVSGKPPIVHFTQTEPKDTLANVRAHPEFVVNVVSEEHFEKMNLSAADCPPNEDEFVQAGVGAAASDVVAVPRVQGVKAALECRVSEIKPVGDAHMVFGEVVSFFVADEVWVGERIDVRALRPVGRLGSPFYSMVESVTRLPMARWDFDGAVVYVPDAKD
jgi:flavin reductase (DIM6/NTAB) family NADH-FMN oxidoreductase RutF